MNTNIITLTDSYKFTHWLMYPENTEAVYSYFEPRTGAQFKETVAFGLQAVILKYLSGVVVTREKIEFAAKLSKAHFGNEAIFNRVGWEYILTEFGGRLPIRIKAVPEGTPVTVSNVLMTVENLGGPKTAFLTHHLETLLSHVWYTSTVATMSREIKKVIKHRLNQTTENHASIDFMLHDFGFRGASSVETAGLGGMAHLVNFLGTDTLVGMEYAMEYYGADLEGLAYSVPATEHSVMTSGGPEGEVELVRRLIKTFPDGILAMVIDSFDDKNFISNVIGKTLKDEILARNGVTVFRPDSGDPEEVTLDIVARLGKAFGFTINSKGYRVLNNKVRVLWGDGIDIRDVDNILGVLYVNGWSAENMVFGMGGGLLQKVHRDLQRFAFKCSAQKRDGVWYDIYKNPVDKSKVSKKGRLKLIKNSAGEFETVNINGSGNDLLETVFEMGTLMKFYTFDEVRKSAKI